MDNSRPPQPQSFSLLVVDDNELLRRVCALTAMQDGIKTYSVSTTLEALDIMQKCQFDVILTDLQVHGTSSEEFYDVLFLQQPKACVVVMSGIPRAEAGLPQWLNELNEKLDYLEKPFSLDCLRNILKRIRFSKIHDELGYFWATHPKGS